MIVTCRYGELSVPSEQDLVVNSLNYYGEWAQGEIDILGNFIDTGDVVVDVGAFVGTHALAFSEMVGHDGKVHAFEPNGVVYSFLEENAEKSPISNTVAYPIALGARYSEGVVVSSWEGNNQGASRLERYEGKKDQEAVYVKTMDTLDLGPVDFIKADVEGMELEVLAGANNTIERFKPTIFMEINSLEASYGVLSWARSRGYSIYGVITPAFNPQNFNHMKDNIFGDAKECGLLLVYSEKISAHLVEIKRLSLPEIQTADDIVLLLLHKSQYPYEVLEKTSAAAQLGLGNVAPYSQQDANEFDGQIASLNQAVDERDGEITSLNQAVDERDGKIASLNQAVDECDGEIASLNQAVDERDDQIASICQTAEECSGKIANLRQIIEERDGQIAKITSSKSWFLTKPLRFFGRLTRGEFAVALASIRSNAEKRDDSTPACDEDLNWQYTIVADLFDESFYLHAYPDVVALGVDPLRHYLTSGWHEKRNPSTHFNTEYYLRANPDIADAGINPLVHYAGSGRQEGRLCQHPGGYRADILQSLESVDEAVIRCTQRGVEPTDSVGELRVLLQKQLKERSAGLVVLSLSHDQYKTNIGGLQVCIEEEQVLLNKAGHIYLHVSPYHPLPVLAEAPTEEALSQIVLDGIYRGLYRTNELNDLFVDSFGLRNVQLVVHALHGHSIEWVLALYQSLKPQEVFYWVHDYFSICPGFNLLRNGVSFCNAPKVSSASCQLCIFGEPRFKHLECMSTLFSKIPFTVVAPSEYALEFWKAKTELPYAHATIHEHRKLDLVRHVAREGFDEAPLRIAFLGHPAPHKGWFEFQSIVKEFGRDSRYRFYHLGSLPEKSLQVEYVQVLFSSESPNAMEQAIRSNEIDVALVLSNCAETFCLIAYEAVASGAMIITTAASGNVSMMVHKDKLGVVVSSDKELFELFKTERLVEQVAVFQQEGIPISKLVSSGSTASLICDKKVIEGIQDRIEDNK